MTGATTDPVAPGRCPACSKENDLFYSYCWYCLAELPSARRSRETAGFGPTRSK